MIKPPDSGQPDAQSLRTDWLAVATVVAAGIVAALQVGKVAIALPAMRLDLGFDLTAAGWITALFALLGVVGGIPVGAAVTRFGDRRLAILGLVTLAGGGAVGALAGNLGVLLASRIVEGAGFLLIVVAAPAVLERIATPKDRDLAFGIWGTFMPAGIAIALLAGPALAGWRDLWLANAILAGVAAIVFALVVKRGDPAPGDLAWQAIVADTKTTLAAGGPLLLALAFAAYNVQYFAIINFLPILLVERMGVSVAAAGALSAVAVGVNVLGNLASGVLLTRGVARWRLLAVTSAVMGLTGVGVFLTATPALAVFVLCVIFSGVGGLLPATVMGGAPQLAPAPRLAPIALGLVVQGGNLGVAIGTVTVGGIVEAAGWSAAALPVAISAVIGVALALALRATMRPPQAATRVQPGLAPPGSRQTAGQR